VFLDDVRVPASAVVGEVDQGFPVLWDVLNPERILAAAGGVGGSEAALRLAADYATQREVFGRPIGANQAIQFPLAQLKAKTELARLMTYKAAWLFDQGRPCGNETNIAKLTAAQVSWESANQAFQTFGGMAYSKEYPVERLFRDSRIGKNIPVAEELILAHIATQMLDLPRSYCCLLKPPPRSCPSVPASTRRSPAAPSSTHWPRQPRRTPANRRTPTSTTCPTARPGAR
jgi:acyl-CoA dehydrogenase